MTGSTLSLCLFVLVLVLCQLNVVKSSGDECFEVTAAFNDEGKLYLVDEDKFVQLNAQFHEEKTGLLKEAFGGPNGEIDAALTYTKDGYLYFFEGNNYFYYPNFWGSTSDPKSNEEWGDFFETGIDAAGALGEDNYFFKGCNFVAGVYPDFEEGENEELGLPCDVDAAWGQGDTLYVTKGDHYYTMGEDKNATGPHSLSDLLTLTTTHICKEEEETHPKKVDPFTAKILAEQKYEEENECVIIDAAITWEDKVYIFNDDEYLTLDAEGKEVSKRDIFEWGGLLPNIDAGVTWVPNGKTYFFHGPHYYKYYYDWWVNAAMGPFSNTLWSPFFEEGIDAAGNHDGLSYFFKGCEAELYEAEDKTKLIKNIDLGLPCDVDAAFSRNGNLYVIKRNQVWTWEAEAVKATGPEDLTSVVKMDAWTACAP